MTVRIPRKARVFWPLALLLLLADCSSKEMVVDRIVPHVPHPVIDGFVRFTLTFNPGAAWGMSLGPFSRVVFSLAAIVAIGVLISLYRQTSDRHTWRLVALALVCAGAAGNLLDRLKSTDGVVDFIDVGVGAHRFGYIFNLADIWLTCGGVLLALLVWRDDAREEHEPPAPPAQPAG